MSAKRHKHADLIHAWAEGAEIEFKSPMMGGEWISMKDADCITWDESCDYRIKPEKKPDVVLYVGLERRTGASAYISDDRVVVNHWSHQLRLTFSGDTGKLIKAEVL